eukprot:2369423-Prymnesium_polylepis.1
MQYTEFRGADDVISHFRLQYKPGMTDNNYGKFWSIAHKIPQFWYNRKDPEDMARANSKANLGCDYQAQDQGEPTNSAKHVTLPSDEELLMQDPASYPKEWEGKIPSLEYRTSKYRSRWAKQ